MVLAAVFDVAAPAKVYGLRQEKRKAAPPDSAELARRDSLHLADSLHRADSAALLGKSSLDEPAFSTARDSIIEVFENGQRKIFYYGDVTVKYQDMELKAERMDYDMAANTVHAYGVFDTLKQEWVGRPVMTQGSQKYNMDDVKYNFTSRKSRITNVLTTNDDGIIHGKNIKMLEEGRINMTGGKYTVCDLEHPHYWMELSAATVMTEPSQKTVFGPAHLVVEDVHLPLFLPFGFIPKRPQRATGMLMPTFGEEEARGFFIRDLGMYFVFGDHFDLSVTGDWFTLGSWAVQLNSRYRYNYKCTGDFAMNYSCDITGEKGSADYNKMTNFGLKWSHQQDSKAHPGSTFSASVNFSSPSNSRYNSRSVSEALESQVSSSISYTRNWNGKFNLSVNMLHSQNSRDSSYAFSLPNISFSVSTFYPFKKKNHAGSEKFYEKISFGYNTSLQNKINFRASEFGQPGFADKFQSGMNHNFSIGLPSFNLLNYLNFNPSISYGQQWYFRDYSTQYNEESGRVETKQNSNFSAFGIMQQGSASISMSTRIYGTFNFGKHHKVQAIRHVISPSISASYTPDLGTPGNGWRTYTYADKDGRVQTYNYNMYTGAQGTGNGKAATASFSKGNNLEAKVRDFADTTGTGSKKVKLIDQLNINGNYNFLADSMKLSNISLTMSTSLFNKISINASAAFNPYAIGEKGTPINRFAVSAGQGLARLTSASISASYSISGKGSIDGNDCGRDPNGSGGETGSVIDGAVSYYKQIFYHPVTGEYIPGGWVYYTNPNVPWSLNMSGQLSYSRSYAFDSQTNGVKTNNSYIATVSLNGNIKLTPRLSINGSTGFDIIAKSITTTQISATYDLHCFNISVSLVPTGMYKQYSFTIAANAAALADILRFRKSSSMWDN